MGGQKECGKEKVVLPAEAGPAEFLPAHTRLSLVRLLSSRASLRFTEYIEFTERDAERKHDLNN